MFSKLLENIYRYDKIFIHSHVNPDGDCLGASFGLYYIIKENFSNKHVYVASEKSQRLSFLGEPDLVFPEMYGDSLSIIVDTPVTERISNNFYKLSETILKVDHHPIVEEFAHADIVDTRCPATCQLVAEFAIDHNLIIDANAATALYTGIITDTGFFKISGVTARTHEVVAKLIQCGAEFTKVHDLLFATNADFYRFKAYFYGAFKVQGDVAYITVNKSDIEKYNVTMEDAADLVNELGNLDGIEKWILFREEEAGYKARLRSKSKPINLIAMQYGGGGHKFASGCMVHTEEEKQQLINEVEALK